MADTVFRTLHAPAERADGEEIGRDFDWYKGHELLTRIADRIPTIVMILNPQRQIVFANHALMGALGIDGDCRPTLGRRPGEVLNCVHATESEGGCGTTEFCRTCGAVNAILRSLHGQTSVQECRITLVGGEVLDLRVTAEPLDQEGERYTIFSVEDIGHEKRRRALERIFFHDILNTAGTLAGFLELLREAGAEDRGELLAQLERIAGRLIEEIRTQRELAAAENQDLVVHPAPLRALTEVGELLELYRGHDVAAQRRLEWDPTSLEADFESDPVLLRRVLGNMIKNALEASRPGDTVTVGCAPRIGQVCFWVHNPTVMAREVQLQIFQRSYSTKGAGRGLGTYSMKYLSNRYLGGDVTFTSAPGDGTTFTACYPLKPG